MKLQLGDKAIEHIARTAIAEAAGNDEVGQKAVIDVIFIRSHSPEKIYKNQIQKPAKIRPEEVKKRVITGGGVTLEQVEN